MPFSQSYLICSHTLSYTARYRRGQGASLTRVHTHGPTSTGGDVPKQQGLLLTGNGLASHTPFHRMAAQKTRTTNNGANGTLIMHLYQVYRSHHHRAWQELGQVHAQCGQVTPPHQRGPGSTLLDVMAARTRRARLHCQRGQTNSAARHHASFRELLAPTGVQRPHSQHMGPS
jgi:hypothetical protein